MPKPSKRVTLACQRAFNWFNKTRHLGLTPLVEDGDWGAKSKAAFKWGRFFIGLRPGVGAGGQENQPTEALATALRNPRAHIRGFSAYRHLERVRLAGKRQRNRRKELKAAKKHGGTDGAKAVAFLVARAGWHESPAGSNDAPFLAHWRAKLGMAWMKGQPYCGFGVLAAYLYATGKKLPQGVVYTPNIVAWAKRGAVLHGRCRPPKRGRATWSCSTGTPDLAPTMWALRAVPRGRVSSPRSSAIPRRVDGGSQSDGGGIYKRVRPVGFIAIVARPK